MNPRGIHTTSATTRTTTRTARFTLGALLALTFLLVSCGMGGPGDGGTGLGSFDLDVVEDGVALTPGGSDSVTVEVVRDAPFVGSVDVTVDDLPAGVTAQPLTIGAGQTSAELVLSASGTAAPVDTEVVTVVGTSGTFSASDVLTVSVGDESFADEDVAAFEGTEPDLASESAVDTETLESGEERTYRLSVPASAEPALFIYLDTELDLYLYDATETLEATSISSEFFAEGDAAIPTTAASRLEPQQISPTQNCPGSCIITSNPGSGVAYVRVVNPYPSAVTFSLYAVLRSFDDANEAIATADDPVDLEVGATETGALETLGDDDYYEVLDIATLFLDVDPDSPLEVVAEITDTSGFTRLLGANDIDGEGVEPGEVVRVFAADVPERAAVAANSTYSLSLE